MMIHFESCNLNFDGHCLFKKTKGHVYAENEVNLALLVHFIKPMILGLAFIVIFFYILCFALVLVIPFSLRHRHN